MKGRALNELKPQFSSNGIRTTDGPGNRTRRQYDFTIPELFPENEADRIPVIAIAGLSSALTIQRFNNEYYNTTMVDTLTCQRGNHSLKGGRLVAFEQKNEYANNKRRARSPSARAAALGVPELPDRQPRRSLRHRVALYSEAEIDLTTTSASIATSCSRRTRGGRHQLTLDYGMRYAVYPAITDTEDVLSTFDPARYDFANAPIFATTRALLVSAPATR